MATFLELQATIEADLSASENNDLTALVKGAINDAISFYEQQRLDFNENRTVAATVAEQAEYDQATYWPNVLVIDQIQYLQSGHQYRLTRQSYEWYLDVLVNQSAQVGPATNYAVYDKTIFLYPQPDEVTDLTISGLHRLTPSPLENDSDTNDWLTGTALQMIRARAKADLYANRLNNPQQAEFQNGVAEQYLEELRANADRLQMQDVVKPKRFF